MRSRACSSRDPGRCGGRGPPEDSVTQGTGPAGISPSSFITSNKNNPWSAQILSCSLTTSIYNINETAGHAASDALRSFQEQKRDSPAAAPRQTRELSAVGGRRRRGSAPAPRWPQLCRAARTHQPRRGHGSAVTGQRGTRALRPHLPPTAAPALFHPILLQQLFQFFSPHFFFL